MVHPIPYTYRFYNWKFLPFEFPMLLTFILFLFFLFVLDVHRIWIPRPGIEPRLSAVKVQSPNHWTTREFLPFNIYSDGPLGFLQDWLVWSPCSPRKAQESSPTPRKSTPNILWKDWCWSWSCNTLMKSQLTGKDPDAGKDWRQKEKGMTEDEMVGWHHWLNGHEFEQALGDGEGHGGLVCCSPWGRKESDMT